MSWFGNLSGNLTKNLAQLAADAFQETEVRKKHVVERWQFVSLQEYALQTHCFTQHDANTDGTAQEEAAAYAQEQRLAEEEEEREREREAAARAAAEQEEIEVR
jgi:hypothetical protein